jgi:hypothetical protein
MEHWHTARNITNVLEWKQRRNKKFIPIYAVAFIEIRNEKGVLKWTEVTNGKSNDNAVSSGEKVYFDRFRDGQECAWGIDFIFG